MPADDQLTEAELRFRAAWAEWAKTPEWKRSRTLFAKWCAEGRLNWTRQRGHDKDTAQPGKGKR